MKPNKQKPYKTSILILFLITGILPSSLCLALEEPLNKKTLDRWLDPVIIRGEQLSELLGTPIDHFFLYRYEHNGLVPIPFQVDERDAQGEFIMTAGNNLFHKFTIYINWVMHNGNDRFSE